MSDAGGSSSGSHPPTEGSDGGAVAKHAASSTVSDGRASQREPRVDQDAMPVQESHISAQGHSVASRTQASPVSSSEHRGRMLTPPSVSSEIPAQAVPYSQEEIERVRQALATAGYPAPRAEDIERVFQHVRAELERQQREVVVPQLPATSHGSGSGGQGQQEPHQQRSVPIPRAEPGLEHRQSRPPPSPYNLHQRGQQPWDASTPIAAPRYQGPRGSVDRSEPYCGGHGRHSQVGADVPPHYRRTPHSAPLDPQHPALYLNPAARLERYMRRYERSLAEQYHSTAPGHERMSFVDDEGTGWGYAAQGYAAAEDDARRGFQASHVLSAPLEETQTGYNVAARPVDAATLRRSANTVFNMTGDDRYRYRPPQPKQRGTLPLDVSRHGRQQERSALTDERAASSSTVPMAETYFNAQRPQRRPHASRLLSTYTVSHLQPDGSTLRAKADPVRRGLQMRELWDRDPFLSQRGWNAERWQARRAAMNYDDT